MKMLKKHLFCLFIVLLAVPSFNASALNSKEFAQIVSDQLNNNEQKIKNYLSDTSVKYLYSFAEEDRVVIAIYTHDWTFDKSAKHLRKEPYEFVADFVQFLKSDMIDMNRQFDQNINIIYNIIFQDAQGNNIDKTFPFSITASTSEPKNNSYAKRLAEVFNDSWGDMVLESDKLELLRAYAEGSNVYIKIRIVDSALLYEGFILLDEQSREKTVEILRRDLLDPALSQLSSSSKRRILDEDVKFTLILVSPDGNTYQSTVPSSIFE